MSFPICQPIYAGLGITLAQATMLFLGAPFANINFYSSIDNEYIHHKVWEKITHPFHNLNGIADGVW